MGGEQRKTRVMEATHVGGDDDDSDVRTHHAIPALGFRPAVQRPHLLEVKEGPMAGTRLVLHEDRYVIGRSREASLRLESDDVSRQHARLTRSDGEFTIEDLDSSNGVYLNGVRVHGAVLRDGDMLQLGDVVLTYREGT